MKRLALIIIIFLLLIVAGGVGAYYFNRYWMHRFDPLIVRQASVYRLDPDLVWSVIYEETYFRPWKRGEAGEVGLMQVTPTVGREWAGETGMRELAQRMERDAEGVLRDPERNIQIGCWYLEKILKDYRDTPDAEARILAAYNAGPSRAARWNEPPRGGRPLTEAEFIARIDIPSTRAYVTSILERYRRVKAERRNARIINDQSLEQRVASNDGREPAFIPTSFPFPLAHALFLSPIAFHNSSLLQ